MLYKYMHIKYTDFGFCVIWKGIELMRISSNPSAIRSKTLITNTLLELMKTEEYHAITISELTLHCELTRKTFYRNYTNKDDVLNSYIEELFQEYQRELSNLSEFTPYNAVYTYFSFCKTHIEFFQLLEKQNLMTFILTNFEAFLCKIGSEFQHMDSGEYSVVTKYNVAFSTGGFWYLLCQWLHSGAKEKPEEMAKICCEFL